MSLQISIDNDLIDQQPGTGSPIGNESVKNVKDTGFGKLSYFLSVGTGTSTSRSLYGPAPRGSSIRKTCALIPVERLLNRKPKLRAAMIRALVVLCAIAGGRLSAATPGDLLDKGYSDMYSLDFEAAHRVFAQWEKQHPDDPLGPVSDAAAYLFFEFDRLNILRADFFLDDRKFLNQKKLSPDPKVKAAFEADLQRAKQLSDAWLKREPSSEQPLFANVIRLALHADYGALIDKQYWQSLNEVKEARIDADALVTKYPDCKDAYLAVGVENYLLSQKVGPVRLFLRMTGAQTDKETGIAKLRIVANEGHYLKPYAKILLALAALRDNKKDEARRLVAELAREFPRNDLFQAELKKLS